MGEIRGGDTRPLYEREALAGHLRHGRGSGVGLRQGSAINARFPSSHQLRLLRHAARLLRHLHHLPRREPPGLLPLRPSRHPPQQPQSRRPLLPAHRMQSIPIPGTVPPGNKLLGLLQFLPGPAVISRQYQLRHRRHEQPILQCNRTATIPVPGFRPGPDFRVRNGEHGMGRPDKPRGVLGGVRSAAE